MAKPLVMQYRRKREGKTDYRRRLVLLKSGMQRLVVRASNKSIQAQLVSYEADGDHVVATARATDLAKHGWKGASGNTAAAYLTGVLLAHRLHGKKAGDIIVDIGLQTHHKGGRLYAVAKGMIDAGFNVRVGEETLPSDERANGEHIGEEYPKMVAAVKSSLIKK